MDIIPGQGVTWARVGETRAAVEGRVGPPIHDPRDRRAVYRTVPMLIVDYYPDDTVEIVQLAYSDDGQEEVFLDGVQLTYRFMDDVVADLAAKGYTCTPSDIGFEYHAGFTIFSTGALWAPDLDPDAHEERAVVDGVGVAPYAYFVGG